ncbi:MAG: AAA family ATPase [Spirochaetales bacterium]|nr:AAA family ATPase [Spirochaetales bacterium]
MSCHVHAVTLHPHNFPTDAHYPFSLPVFHHTREVRFQKPVTFFAGENGSGKSTLLEAIATACGIHIWRREDGTRYCYNPYEKLLYKYVSVQWADGAVPGSFFGSETFNDFRRILDGWAAADPGQLSYFGGESLVTKSHGQSMMSYFTSRYALKGVYFLDEPETALSPKSQLKLLDLLKAMTEAGHAQFIIATHSPLLLSFENADIFSFDADELRIVDYQDTEHYRVYKEFLSAR